MFISGVSLIYKKRVGVETFTIVYLYYKYVVINPTQLKIKNYRLEMNKIGGSLSKAGKISKRCVVYALTGSRYTIVNHLFTGSTDDVL